MPTSRLVSRTLIGTAAATCAALLTACSGGPNTEPGPTLTPIGPTTHQPTPTLSGHVQMPVQPGVDVAGLIAVNGHDLYVRCKGNGSPTVLYIHGWIDDPQQLPADYVQNFERELGGDYRVCSYDRANVGRSEHVGTRQPEDLVADTLGVLDALGEESPVIVVGSSFGGSVAEAFIVSHPEQVAGVVLVDADIPDTAAIEYLVPPGVGACDPANRDYDANESLELTDNCQLFNWTYEHRAAEPSVPLIFLAASRAERNTDAPEWDAQLDDLRRAFADRWAPGEYRVVESGHVMEVDAPAAIAAAIRDVAARGR